MQEQFSVRGAKRKGLLILVASLVSTFFPAGINLETKTLGAVPEARAAGVFYASPTGLATNAGTQQSPWDLRTALKSPSVNAGSTLYLKGGVYKGSFTSSISGIAGNPVTVQPAPGENAVIDGNDSFSLGTTLASNATTCEFPNATRTFDAGPSVMLDDEALYLINQTGTNKYSCLRGWDGTAVVAHNANGVARVKGPGLQVNGSNVWFIGLEVTNSFTERYFPTFSGNTDTPKKAGGIYVSAPGVKLINNKVHDVSHPGISMFDAAQGCSDAGSSEGKNQCTEAYGNLVWGNGFYDQSRGNQPNGAGIYTHNSVGNKYIRDNIFFRNLSQGIDMYTRESKVRGFQVEGNTVFDNGYWDVWFGNDEYGSGVNITNNVIFRRLNASREALILGSGQPLVNPVIRDNYIIGGNGSNSPFAFSLNRLTGGTITGNTFISPGTINIIGTCTGGGQQADLTCNNPFNFSGSYTDPETKAIINSPLDWNGNKYFGTAPKSFARPQQLLNYPEWKNFYKTEPNDTQNKNFTPGYPSENKVLVRKNIYTPGRGNVTVVNWTNAPSVQANLSSILAPGDTYSIKDAQNYDRYDSDGAGGLVFKQGTVVASGTYNGSSVAIPMNQSSVAKLFGSIETSTNLPGDGKPTAPLFGAYVVEKVTSGITPAPSPTPPVPTPTPTPTPTPPPAGPPSNNVAPIGSFDGIKSDTADMAYGTLFGWAKDENEPDKAVILHVYVDKVACAGCSPTIVQAAGDTRSDVGAHGFNIPIPGLYKDGVSHTYRVYAIDTQGGNNPMLGGSPKSFTWNKSTNPTPPPTGGTWSATYWNNKTLTGNPAATKTEADINFSWGKSAPASGVNVDNFSARYQREMDFQAGTYTFTVTADDGVRFYVDNQMKLDQWRDTAATTYNFDVDLPVGTHALRMDYYENGGDATAKISLTKKPGAAPLPPLSTTYWTTAFWNNKTLSGNHTVARTDTDLNFEWGNNSPDTFINPDGFSSKFERAFDLEAGTYKFTVTGDDGIRLYVDNQLKIDQWRDTSVMTYNTEVELTAGRHTIRVEQYDNTGLAVAKFSYEKLGTAPPPVPAPAPVPTPTPTPAPTPAPSVDGWQSQFWSNATMTGAPVVTRKDEQINFDWGNSSPATGVSQDKFSSRFERVLGFEEGTYTFTVTADDGTRLYVDDQIKIDQWRDTSVATYNVDVPLTAGNHIIRLEQYDNTGLAIAKLVYVKKFGPAPTPIPTPTPSPSPSPVPAPLVIIGPTSTSITQGQSAIISVQPYNSVSISVVPNIPGCTLSATTSVSCTVQPSTTTTYTFTVTNSAGQAATNTSTVTVSQPTQPTAPAEVSPMVKVTLPTAGDYKQNSNITISWNVTGNWQSKGWPNYNGNPYVSLDLYQNGQKIVNLSQSINFTNTVTFSANYAVGSNYSYKISATGDPTVNGFSAPFNIVP